MGRAAAERSRRAAGAWRRCRWRRCRRDGRCRRRHAGRSGDAGACGHVGRRTRRERRRARDAARRGDSVRGSGSALCSRLKRRPGFGGDLLASSGAPLAPQAALGRGGLRARRVQGFHILAGLGRARPSCPEPCCGLLGRSARRPTAASRRAGARPGVLGRPSDTASPAAGAVSVLGVSEGDWVDLVARMALVGLA